MRQEGERFLKEQITRRHVAVIGDIMLDKYISGQVSRISPEAPVPVNLVRTERSVLGGAANTAHNLAALGCHVYIAGVTGADDSGSEVSALLSDAQVDKSGVFTLAEYKTTTKVRILGARQQMMRLDFEEPCRAGSVIEQKIFSWVQNLAGQHMDSIVISDYGKGLITPSLAQQIITYARERGIPVLVDPKGSNWDKYDSAYAITPNLKELSDCVGYAVPNEDGAVEEAGRAVLEKYHLDNLLVTRSEKGISSVQNDRVTHCPAKAQDVFDVSGAGDTVMAVLAAAVGSGLDTETILNLANTAAGISVSRVGTYSVKREEVLARWKEEEGGFRHTEGAVSWEEAEAMISYWKSRGEKVVFTNGCFDILHRGHLTYLAEAAELGDHLIIGLNSDDSVRRLKGSHRPVNGEADRAFMLSALRFVDAVVLFSEDTPEKLLSCLKPDILVKGGDYQPEEVAGRQYAGEVRILPFVDGYSTTDIIAKIKKEK